MAKYFFIMMLLMCTACGDNVAVNTPDAAVQSYAWAWNDWAAPCAIDTPCSEVLGQEQCEQPFPACLIPRLNSCVSMLYQSACDADALPADCKTIFNEGAVFSCPRE